MNILKVHVFLTLIEEHISTINQPFTNIEIEIALFQISGTKAFGLDEMPAIFYQTFCPTLAKISFE